jgi:hypothetical protein
MKLLAVALLLVAPLFAASKAELALRAEIARLQAVVAAQTKATQIAQTAATQSAQGAASQTALARDAAEQAARAREELADQAAKAQELLTLQAVQNQNTLAQVTRTVAREKAAAAAATAKTLSTLSVQTKTASQKADEVRQAQNDNAGTAQAAVEDAKAAAREQAAATARLAESSAEAAAVAKRSDAAVLETAKSTQLTQIGLILATLTGFGAMLWKGYIDARTHTWALEAEQQKTRAVIVKQIQQIETSSTARANDNAVTETGIVARIAAMTAQYILTRVRELPAMRRELEDRDFETLGWLTHNLAGTGASFGYPEVSRLGALMESAARDRDGALFQSLLDGFSTYIHSVPEPDLTTLALLSGTAAPPALARPA